MSNPMNVESTDNNTVFNVFFKDKFPNKRRIYKIRKSINSQTWKAFKRRYQTNGKL